MAGQQLSRAAYERLKAEFDDLTTRGRIEVAEEIEAARAEGDLRENAGYHAAKDAEIVESQRVFTMIYAGDSHDMAERYVVGNQEEKDGLPTDITIVGPASPLGVALAEAGVGPLEYGGPDGRLQVEILAIEEI